ncbi:hypothetical protein [Mesorhizobium sp. ES1-1]|uniref:hypothetical protein n=1 Tax=Mesorhizobium sp. ES1-1 TaxID=2876629 RepID=UPI001CCDB297|nr:hypothetical protein [Mesorhizobium sp. ES1-1]MBZ9675676.1 hypothetical protein [Mesorhizobium sp. ES1-1]
MTSDFTAAHVHLERACYYLRGNDETSRSLRDTLDLVIEAVVEAQHRRPSTEVVEFPHQAAR